jgi:hypothetical protein
MFDRFIQISMLVVTIATFIVAMPNYTPPAEKPAPAPLYVGRG